MSQLRFVTTGGADIPLIEAQKNYADFGASERGFLRNVRELTPEDIRERSWYRSISKRTTSKYRYQL